MEVAGAEEEQELESPADLDLRWLHRNGDDSPIPGELRALDLPAGPGRAWGGGESTTMQKVRRHLREVRGLAPETLSVLGYWKAASS